MLKNEKINVIYDTVVEEIVGENKVSNVILKNTKSGETESFPADGIFEYIGMNPISEFVHQLKITDEEGWIITDDRMKTTIPGIFAVGDIRKNAVRQVVAATGDGCVAALEAQHYLESLQV